jgi:toxin-antitoxin system PIN domain toxin
MSVLVDANLLIYAFVESAPNHPRARAWLEKLLNDGGPVGLPWESLLAFFRFVTHPKIATRPLSSREAWAQVRLWTARSNVMIPAPGERHEEILARLIEETNCTSGLIHDAHLAALAIEHGLRLCSTDGDFGRFRGLTWVNPLLGDL